MSRFFGLLALAALLCMSAVSGQTCGGAGYDLSSLQGQQFYYFDGTYHFTVSPCGVVNNATACPNPNYPNTAFCQTRPGNNGTSLAQYTAGNSTWGQTLNGNGVVQELRDGTFCGAEGGADGGGPRETSIVYQCVPAATTPYLINVTEVHTCFYTAYVATAAACTRQANAATGPNSAYGTRYFDGRCGGGAYDLSPLQQVDLFYTPNASTTTTVWFLRVCGAVSAANCTATSSQGGAGVPTETAMLCQSDQTNPTGNDHAAAFYVPGLQQWTVPSAAGGLRMEIQDGQACGTWSRQTTIEFSCDASATTPVLVDVIEHITCYYTARVRTNLVCPQYFLAGSTGAAQPSQSSSAVPSVSSGINTVSSSSGSQPGPGNGGGGNGAATTTVSAVVVAAVVAVAALML